MRPRAGAESSSSAPKATSIVNLPGSTFLAGLSRGNLGADIYVTVVGVILRCVAVTLVKTARVYWTGTYTNLRAVCRVSALLAHNFGSDGMGLIRVHIFFGAIHWV